MSGEVRWRDLNRGDVILCPASELPETVTMSHRYTGRRWFVRTTRHDHYRLADEAVVVLHRRGES